ncbi:putative DCD domain-containing protein NRP [Helianthus debilis subsp. tardiflorus]
MGARKKESNYTSNRNLGKNQLGGVIFGATNITFNECLSKQLFGLPKEHLEYVEKIVPGLPLFLFNYTDRKLHGVFEAASHGQKDIDPYAWTVEGKQKTPFAAQVQVRVQSARQPLTETQFKPVILDNYFTQNHFWFELDHAQTNRLLSLFSSQPVSFSLFTTNFPSVPKKAENRLKEKKAYTSFSGKTVSSDTLNDCIRKDEEEHVCMKLKELALNRKFSDPPTAREDEAARVNVDPHSAAREDDTTVENSTSLMEDSIIAQLIEKVEDLMAFKTEQTNKIEFLEKKVIFLEQNLAEARNEIRYLKDPRIKLESMVGPSEESHTKNGMTSSNAFDLDKSPDTNLDGCDDLIFLVGGYDGMSWFSSLDAYSPSNDCIKSRKPMNTARCYAPVSVLNGELYVFGGGTRGVWYDTVESYNPVVNEWTGRPALNAKKGSLAGATLNGKIYAVGGGSDDVFYSAVEMLDLDIGAWIPTRSMLQKRFSLAAAELNGAIYAVGGYDGESYLKSAERFDPREHSWTRIESMNTMRGCPCLVILNEKLYVIGGFDGNDMVPSVEIYDPRRGSWMSGEPMKYPRGFSAAAVVNESIYVFGGLKSGDEINDTVERYKEGQGWESLETKASGRRCFFSAVGLSS